MSLEKLTTHRGIPAHVWRVLPGAAAI